jgi:hypothetical protein
VIPGMNCCWVDAQVGDGSLTVVLSAELIGDSWYELLLGRCTGR